MKILRPSFPILFYFLSFFIFGILIWDFVPSGSVGSSLYPKQAVKVAGELQSCQPGVFNEQNLRVDANCSQTPDGRGHAGDGLQEIKSEHWSGPEEDKRLPSDSTPIWFREQEIITGLLEFREVQEGFSCSSRMGKAGAEDSRE